MRNIIFIIAFLTINFPFAGTSYSRDQGNIEKNEEIFHDSEYIPVTHFDEITLERGPCFGHCPVYKIVIKGDGSVAYKGKSHVLKIGSASETLSQEKIDGLVSAINQVEYSSISLNNYSEGCVTCDRVVYTSVKIGAKQYNIKHNLRACGVVGLSQIKKFEDNIDEIVNIEQWIGTEAERKKAREEHKQEANKSEQTYKYYGPPYDPE